jgi:hypothetical protein
MRNVSRAMNRYALSVALITFGGALAWMPASPRVRPETPPAVSIGQAAAHGPNGTPRNIAYTVAPVVHPGHVEGTIRFRDAVPTRAPLAVPPEIAQSQHACGTSTPDFALAVDPASRGLANAVIYLADITRGAAPAAAPVTIQQEHCAFGPHVVATTVGGTLRIGNRDFGVLHNLHGYYGLVGDDAMFNLGSPSGITVARAIDRGGIHRIVCDAGHTWMLLYVHAFDHPYYAVTDASGHYRIDNVPPGTYRLHVWHEGWTANGTDAHGRPAWSAPVEAERSITVALNGAITADAEYTAAATAAFAQTRR